MSTAMSIDDFPLATQVRAPISRSINAKLIGVCLGCCARRLRTISTSNSKSRGSVRKSSHPSRRAWRWLSRTAVGGDEKMLRSRPADLRSGLPFCARRLVFGRLRDRALRLSHISVSHAIAFGSRALELFTCVLVRTMPLTCAPLRASQSDAPLHSAIDEAIARKPKSHDFVIDRRHQEPALQRHTSMTGG